MLCSMANSGCLLVSNSGMLPHSLPCPPAFLYLQQVSHPLQGIFLLSVLSGSHVFLAGSLLAEGKSLTASCQPPHSSPTAVLPLGRLGSSARLLGFLRFPRRGGRSTAGAEARAVRQAEPPVRVQRLPASALLPLGDDGCSGEGTRLPCGLSRREGDELVRAHVCTRMCACADAALGRARVCPAVTGRCCRGTGDTWCQAGAELGQPRRRLLRSVWSFTWAKVLLSHRATLGPCWTLSAGFLGPSSQGKRSLGEAASSSNASVLHRKSRLPARQTAPFVLSRV